MRQVVLDTETTGLEPSQGHRVIEIGCVELIDRKLTGQRFHRYINPEREVEAGALEVHGIDNAFLADKPRFVEIVDELIEFVNGAELIIHNAPFDVGFLDHELALASEKLGRDLGQLRDYCTVLDTLVLARELHPGQRNSLDALCKRYGIDNSQRELHGALLDAEILAEVFLAMTGGQVALSFSTDASTQSNHWQIGGQLDIKPVKRQGNPLTAKATSSELEAHRQYLDKLAEKSGESVWRKLQWPEQ